MKDEDRLFVPLSTKWFNEYKRGRKTVELRGISSLFNVNTVIKGRKVELRRGYSTKESLWGTITSVWTIRSIAQLQPEELKQITPFSFILSRNDEEWLEAYEEKYRNTGFICFKVKLNDDDKKKRKERGS